MDKPLNRYKTVLSKKNHQCFKEEGVGTNIASHVKEERANI